MAQFDAKAFAAGLVGPCRTAIQPILEQATEQARDIIAAVERFELDVSETLDALAVSQDARRSELLRADLERFLPARRDAIIARAATLLASDAQAILETVLTIAEKAAIVAAKAMI